MVYDTSLDVNLGRGREFIIFVGRCMCKDTDRYLSW